MESLEQFVSQESRRVSACLKSGSPPLYAETLISMLHDVGGKVVFSASVGELLGIEKPMHHLLRQIKPLMVYSGPILMERFFVCAGYFLFTEGKENSWHDRWSAKKTTANDVSDYSVFVQFTFSDKQHDIDDVELLFGMELDTHNGCVDAIFCKPNERQMSIQDKNMN